MTTTRLNNDLRDQLIRDILNDRFAEEEAVLFDRRAALAQKIYEVCEDRRSLDGCQEELTQG